MAGKKGEDIVNPFPSNHIYKEDELVMANGNHRAQASRLAGYIFIIFLIHVNIRPY